MRSDKSKENDIGVTEHLGEKHCAKGKELCVAVLGELLKSFVICRSCWTDSGLGTRCLGWSCDGG